MKHITAYSTAFDRTFSGNAQTCQEVTTEDRYSKVQSSLRRYTLKYVYRCAYPRHRLGKVAQVVQAERDAGGGSRGPRHEQKALHAAGVDEVVGEALVAQEDGEQAERVERETHVVPRARGERRRQRERRLHLRLIAGGLERQRVVLLLLLLLLVQVVQVRAHGARARDSQVEAGSQVTRAQVDVVEDQAQNVSLEENGQQLRGQRRQRKNLYA